VCRRISHPNEVYDARGIFPDDRDLIKSGFSKEKRG
jgi:hypothetical protein